MHRSLTRALAALSLVLAVAACSGDDTGKVVEADEDATAAQVDQDPTETATPTAASKPDLPSEDDLRFLVDALASNSIAQMEAARKLTMSGSLADAYFVHQIAVENASIDGGLPAEQAGEVRSKGQGYEACFTYEGERSCYTYDSFEGAKGKVVDFNINRLALEKRVVVGTSGFKSGTGLDVEGKFVSAYLTASGDSLAAALQLRSGDTPISISGAAYRSPNGRQSNSQGINGPFELGPRSLSNYLLNFPGAELGGTLTLTYYVDGGSDASIEFKTK